MHNIVAMDYNHVLDLLLCDCDFYIIGDMIYMYTVSIRNSCTLYRCHKILKVVKYTIYDSDKQQSADYSKCNIINYKQCCFAPSQ